MALAGRTSAQGHHVAAVARAFWLRRSSSNRRWLAHEIVQQPVKLFRPKSAKVLEMPDFIGCLQFFTFCFKWANRPQITWKSVLHGTAPWRRPRSRLCPVFGATVELERSLRDIFGPAGLRIDTLPVLNFYTVPKPTGFAATGCLHGTRASRYRGSQRRGARKTTFERENHQFAVKFSDS